MNTHVELDALDLCMLELTGNRQELFGTHQAWTKGHSRNGDSIVMYLTAEQALDIAAHFTALAAAIDATIAADADPTAVAS